LLFFVSSTQLIAIINLNSDVKVLEHKIINKLPFSKPPPPR